MVVLRSLVGVFPLVLLVACGGSSKSHDPGGRGGQGGAGGSTGGSGGTRPDTGGAGGASATGGAGGRSATGGTGAGAVGGSGGSGAVGAMGGFDGCRGPDCPPAEPVDPPGTVYCGGSPCDAPNACCTATSTCFDPASEPDACPEPEPDGDERKTCASNSHCRPSEFCMMDGPGCEGTGHCQARNNCGFCTGDACAVCGCDGNTYPDQQTACRAGANTVSHGACGKPMETGGGGSGPGGELPVRVRIPCGTQSHCPDEQVCCTRLGYCTEDDPYLCEQAPEGTIKPCLTDDHCDPGQYCLGEGCSGPGGCVFFGSQGDCGVRLEPVCGCNGVSYTSAACASSEGVRVASVGQCPAK